jgi:hypothetical protein
VGLERDPLSLVITIEELLGRKSRGSGLENREYGRRGPSYKMLLNILLSRLGTYKDEIIGDHQCGLLRNRSTTDQIFCIRQILEKKWEYTINRIQEGL